MRVNVGEEFRQRGLGFTICQYAIEWWKAKNQTKADAELGATIDINNLPSQMLCSKLGFVFSRWYYENLIQYWIWKKPSLRELDRKWNEAIRQDRENRADFQTTILDQIHDFDVFAAFLSTSMFAVDNIEDLDVEWRDLLMRKTLELMAETRPEQASVKVVSKLMLRTLYEDKDQEEEEAVTEKAATWAITMEDYEEAASIYEKLAEAEPESTHQFHALICRFLVTVYSKTMESFTVLDSSIAKLKHSLTGEHESQFIELCLDAVKAKDIDAFINVVFQYDAEYEFEHWIGLELLKHQSNKATKQQSNKATKQQNK